ncbi:MAG: hypothetical protein WB798_15575, partial [Nocardioidaceae bacterium]
MNELPRNPADSPSSTVHTPLLRPTSPEPATPPSGLSRRSLLRFGALGATGFALATARGLGGPF